MSFKNFMAQAIEDRLFLATANPGYLISVAEQGVKDTAIRMGCREYWRYWPFRVRLAKTYGTQQTTTTITFDEIWTAGEPRIDLEQQKHAYILGITRGNLPSWNMRSNPNMFDRQLLGVNLSANNFDPVTQLTYETYEDLSHGQMQFDIDMAAEKIHVLAPFGIGQIIFDIGLGFDDPNYISPSREEWVCDFCEYYFLDSIITMRSSVVLLVRIICSFSVYSYIVSSHYSLYHIYNINIFSYIIQQPIPKKKKPFRLL